MKALVAATPVAAAAARPASASTRAMLLFAVALALLTAIAFGVVPAMLMARGDMQRPLKESGRGGDGGGARRRARSTLVVAEIGLAVMLLVGAALLGAQLPAARAAGSRLQAGARGHGERRAAVLATPTSRRSPTSTIGC